MIGRREMSEATAAKTRPLAQAESVEHSSVRTMPQMRRSRASVKTTAEHFTGAVLHFKSERPACQTAGRQSTGGLMAMAGA
jgi:hypothetical protein